MRLPPGSDFAYRDEDGETSFDRPIILVAEDEWLIRMAVSEHLRECGFFVIEASSAGAARAALETTRIDAVFSDINMPGARDGIDLALWIEANHPTVAVVLTSGVDLALNAAVVACKSLRGVIGKPYEWREVEYALRAIVHPDEPDAYLPAPAVRRYA